MLTSEEKENGVGGVIKILWFTQTRAYVEKLDILIWTLPITKLGLLGRMLKIRCLKKTNVYCTEIHNF